MLAAQISPKLVILRQIYLQFTSRLRWLTSYINLSLNKGRKLKTVGLCKFTKASLARMLWLGDGLKPEVTSEEHLHVWRHSVMVVASMRYPLHKRHVISSFTCRSFIRRSIIFLCLILPTLQSEHTIDANQCTP